MIRNNYIAYGLWFLGGLLGLVGLPIGGGLHRIYCGKFISGFAQIALYWLGAFTVWFLVGFVFLLFWGIWWLVDLFFIGLWVEDLNGDVSETKDADYAEKIRSVEALYELYQKGAISKEEYEVRKDILMRN
ncbi:MULTISPECIES: SHOCT domain-containing protein [unclassified Campylobacter]|uniref:SHOCT domain-containing protein n=1 Tax=unclassified Campylobacter TaxID=2593542 RepID=UPI0022EA0DE8|nr:MULTISPECIES: SHOCT domain-containing protein [unclassified Campylobacter]MDA3080065.1 SHOCT domain-containing protein [Campylobacter sp. CS_NA2]MDA3081715.1 SHOCT domain-containing protein [Campylobacter sp. CS_NA1]MDA3086122.1 SHOCT domain-containing protein [Campylobacter sp. CS_ED1]MDA3090929.1 SHOCT domain-containing protein [Campylobacter sp. CS_ED2]WBR51198.1 SHOCT domain-containing protein [Campylobacter sp. CS_NA3]